MSDFVVTDRHPGAELPTALPLPARSFSVVQRPGLLLWAASVAMLSVPLFTLIDVPVARWFDQEPFSSDFSDAIELTRGYAHGSGVFFILVAVILLAPDRRWLIPRVAVLTCGAGAIATVMKMFVLRPKPSQINLDFATIESAWLWRFDWMLEQVASFDAGTRAFPSGNMATAIAMTIGLCIIAPRGRWLFLLFCGLTILQRLHSGSHFLSDVLGGAAAGFGWSYICLHPRMLGSLFDKMEPEGRLLNEGKAIEVVESFGLSAPESGESFGSEDRSRRAA